MSTISMAAAGVGSARPATRTRLRITARGRRVLAALAAAPLVGAIAAGVLGGGIALGSGEQGAEPGSFATVTVSPGESLWTIAERVAPSADPRDVVAEIASLNQLGAHPVQAGQTIAIPAQFSSDS
ncbi:LysM peptidoglycan-binding domain-containing protein [Microbacterium sp. gxy059]|uniref:LysM peptidoglycan-binding domain-containing protein n=1 Tax=Microbacterium sp. gxy059 TaxID=2957199 RepID=UPI003D976BB6